MWFSRSVAWDAEVYWALDLETGGFDARRDAILAVGMLPVREGLVRLGEAWRTLVRPEPGTRVSPASIRTHGIVEAELAAAPPLAEVLAEIERRISGGVLLVHHEGVDVAFLRRAFDRVGRRWPRPPVVDTARLLLAHADRERRRRPELPGDPPNVNLAAARRAFGLPEYPVHDALADAVAAAELFLVLRAELEARTLRDLTR
jgi:DNA polymerase-3 subunit epsilon